MEEINIYSSSDELVLSVLVDDDSYRLQEIMGDNRLELNFSLDNFVEFMEGDYCEFKGERYWMPRSLNYTKEHSKKFVYKLAMEGSTWMAKAAKFKFFDYTVKPSQPGEGLGEVTPTSSFKLKFHLTGSPEDFAKLFIANLKLKYPGYPWAVGECIESEPMLIDFSSDYCFDILAKLAEKFSTEWELDRYTLHIRKIEKMKESAIDLSYGYNNGLLGGIERLQYDSTKIINRVYIDASDRNTDRSTYGNETLLLPKNQIIIHEGIEYKTDASGSYLERVNPLAGEEDGLDISKIYPKRVGVVSAVVKVDDSKGLYDIIDDSIPELLDYSKQIIAGETMTLIFQTGQLAGKEFDVKYKHSTRKFELAPIKDNGLIYPKGSLVPVVGDKYAVFHISMPEQYITDAENEALQETVKYLYDNEQSQYTYRFTLDGLYAKRNWGAIRGFLNPGFFVKFSDPQFLPDPVDIRIIAVKEYVNDDKAPEITIANNVSSKTFGSVVNKIQTQEQATDRKDQEVIQYAKRGFTQAQETMQMLIDAALDGFDDAIKPIAIQSMMGLFGSEALAYYYVTSKTNPIRIPSGISFSKSTKRITCPDSIIQHQMIGLGGKTLSSLTPDKYTYWNTKTFQSDVLTENTSYYLYLLCAKMNQSNGQYIISKTALSAGDYPDDYVLLVGVLNKEDETGDRSWVELFGMTEILPGRINTDKIVSTDGQNYFDLAQGKFKAGNIDWNVTEGNTLSILGFINALGAILGGFEIDNNLFKSIQQTNGVRNIVLNGKTGFAQFISGLIGGWQIGQSTLTGENNNSRFYMVLGSTGDVNDDPTKGKAAGRLRMYRRADDKLKVDLGAYYDEFTQSERVGIALYNDFGEATVRHEFDSSIYNLINDGGYTYSTVIYRGNFAVFCYKEGTSPTQYMGEFRARATNEKLELIAKGLPTSKIGLSSGSIWRDGEVLKIVP